MKWLGYLFLVLLISCNKQDVETTTIEKVKPKIKWTLAKNKTPKLLSKIKRNTLCFTQGLEIKDSLFYESCGRYNESKVQISNYQGEVLFQNQIEAKYFAEGFTQAVSGHWAQLTWKSGEILFWDSNLEKSITLPLPTAIKEGWGIAQNNNQYYISDGGNKIHLLDETFNLKTSMVVTLNGVPQSNLNELEWVNGYIYANQWQTSNVLKISPQSGEVVEVLDLKFLNKEIPKEYHRKIDVLNGIAYDESSKTLWLTGKYWPYYFQISP